MAVVAQPLSPARAFRPARRVDGRLLAGAAVFALSMLGLTLGLGMVLPENQSVLQVTRNLPAGAIVQADDVALVKVRMPESMVRAAFGADQLDAVVGQRLGSAVTAGQMLGPTQFGSQRASLQPGRVHLTIPVQSYVASGGQLAPGDTVMVFATPKQANGAAASVLVPQAMVISVGRGGTGLTVMSGSGSTDSPAAPATWVTLDLDQEQARSVSAATQTAYLDVGVVAAAGEEVSR